VLIDGCLRVTDDRFDLEVAVIVWVLADVPGVPAAAQGRLVMGERDGQDSVLVRPGTVSVTAEEHCGRLPVVPGRAQQVDYTSVSSRPEDLNEKGTVTTGAFMVASW